MKIHLFTGQGKSKTEKAVVLALAPVVFGFAFIGVFYIAAREGFKIGKESVTL